MRYRVVHTTRYRYSEPASLSQNELWLQPRETLTQTVDDWHLDVLPRPQHQRQREDYFGNTVHVVMVHHPHLEMEVTGTSTVTTTLRELPPAETTMPWEEVVKRLAAPAGDEEFAASQYRFTSPLTRMFPELSAFAAPFFMPGRPILASAMSLMENIYSQFTYDKGATSVDTPVEQVLTDRKGVCQDFAHLMLSALRSLGLSARYVSGYLETQPPPGKPKLVGADASHAWLSLYVPEVGWVDLDPTNNCLPGQQHITVAWGRDYGDVTPVKGVVMGGGSHSLSVMVDVTRLE